MTLATYLLGGILYAMLCVPAVNQRGYPPIDPIWTGMTFLWVSPILLTSLIGVRPLRRRLYWMAIYCLVTAFIDAAAQVFIVPKSLDFMSIAAITAIAFGPFHLAVGFAVEATIEGIRCVSRHAAPNMPPPIWTVVRWTAFGFILILAVAFHFLWRKFEHFASQSRGIAQAEEDWRAHDARIFVAPFSIDDDFWGYDAATGLRRDRRPPSKFTEAYNRRVRELLAERGVPEWSMKRFVVAKPRLLGLLRSDALAKVESFPHEVNENLILFRGGTIQRWGSTMHSDSDGLSIASKDSLMGISQTSDAAYVGRLPEHPDVIFVRSGNNWIGAFHKSGRLLSNASSDQ